MKVCWRDYTQETSISAGYLRSRLLKTFLCAVFDSGDVSLERGRVGHTRWQFTGPVDLLTIGQPHFRLLKIPLTAAVLLANANVVSQCSGRRFTFTPLEQ